MNFSDLIAKGGAFFAKRKLSDIQKIYDAGSAAEKAAFQSSVSGGVSAIPGGTIVLLGDSNTDLCGGLRLSGVQENYPAQGYWTWAQSILGYRFKRVINAGISGDTLEGMDARFATDVAAYSPSVVSLLGGTNNVLSSVNAGNIETKVASAKSAIMSIVAKTAALGVPLVIGTIGPYAPGAAPTTAMYQARARLNQFIRDVAGTTKGVIIADYAAASTDPATPGLAVGVSDGGPQLIFDNQVHVSAAGAMVWGTVLANALSAWLNTTRRIPHGKEPGQFIATNPTLSGSNGTTVPTNWNFASSAGVVYAYSYSDRTDGVSGRQLKATVTAGSGEARLFTFETADASIVPGMKLVAAIELEIEQTAAQQTAVGAYMDMLGAGFATLATCNIMRDSSFNSGGLTRVLDAKAKMPSKMTLVTPPIVVPVGTTIIGLTLQMYGPVNPTVKCAVVWEYKD